MSQIPIVDFSGFDGHPEVRLVLVNDVRPSADSTTSQRTGKELYTACKDVGFAYLVGCFDEQRVDEMFDWVGPTDIRWGKGGADASLSQSRKFFELSEELKQKAPHPPEGWKHRGYSGIGLEKISKVDVSPTLCILLYEAAHHDSTQAVNAGEPQPLDTLPDYKESFDFGRAGHPASRVAHSSPLRRHRGRPGARERLAARFAKGSVVLLISGSLKGFLFRGNPSRVPCRRGSFLRGNARRPAQGPAGSRHRIPWSRRGLFLKVPRERRQPTATPALDRKSVV